MDSFILLGDFVVACAVLAITFPLIIIVALAIKSESPGPVLDRRASFGRDGRRFQMLAFRTTSQYPASTWRGEETRLGPFLRDTRIKALPQLINVLRGDMRLIDSEILSGV